jgi:glycine dehydrogenase subunit 1
MPYIPHTEEEVRSMLSDMGLTQIEQLFDEIPPDLFLSQLTEIPPALSESEIRKVMQERAGEQSAISCFAGAGAYDHHIPAPVWQIAQRGEFYTAYTPYQAEASQGTLQLLYEYQTMMARLTAMEVSNASLYDGATALAEAILMAVRSDRRKHAARILMPETVHPAWRKVVQTLVTLQGIEVVDIPFDAQTGKMDQAVLAEWAEKSATALVLPFPSFFGLLEDVDALTDWAHKQQMRVIAVVNPLALGMLKPPGEWGEMGADLVCGEGQSLGIPLSSGGPWFGFLCCRKALVRQMPGRVVGMTEDSEGKPGYVLTLQAREQHIRRSKATSNICTNQGWMVTAATIYLALMGSEGLYQVARHCHLGCERVKRNVSTLPGVRLVFEHSPGFHEVVVQFAKPVEPMLEALRERGILAGVSLVEMYPSLPNSVLICVTEQRTDAEIDALVEAFREWC